jgi:endonuclease YncB( thermonuclease family)
MYDYRAVVTSVVDGDTIVAEVDLGFHAWHHGPFRLAGCNARELHAPGGPEARDHLAALLPPGTPVTIQSTRPGTPVPDDKYAPRYDAAITLPDGRDLVTVLVAEHWAAPWDGRGPAPVPPWPRPEDTT